MTSLYRLCCIGLCVATLPLVLSAQPNRCNTQTIWLPDTTIAPFQLGKPGYKLVFHDEFNAPLDTVAWNVSAPRDADFPDCQYCAENPGKIPCTEAPFSMNWLRWHMPPAAQNVFTRDGNLVCRISHDTTRGDCGFTTGEVKSYRSVINPAPYRDWVVRPGSYLEIRAKLPQSRGVASAAWLYHGWTTLQYREIDIWETYAAPAKDNAFATTYHNGLTGQGDPNFSTISRRFRLRQGANLRREAVGSRYITFGVAIDSQYITSYIDGRKVWQVNTNEPNCRGKDLLPPIPMCIRIGTGSALGIGTFPVINGGPEQELNVDYIRLYQPSDSLVTAVIHLPDTISLHGGDNISVRYYPGIRYEWSSEVFGFIENFANAPHCLCDMQWLHVRDKSIRLHRSYPVRLTATLPDGRTESQEWQIVIVP